METSCCNTDYCCRSCTHMCRCVLLAACVCLVCVVLLPGGATKALACTTALHRTLLQDGFKVLETAGPAESVDMLAQITK